jgi:UDP-glucose 4-epimerase
MVRPLPVGSEDFRRFFQVEPPFDFIFHLAGRATATGSVKVPANDFAANVGATLELLEQLRLRRASTRLIYASSAAVYGRVAKLPIAENDAAMPVSPYGLSKLMTEQYIRLYASLYGLSATSVRPFSVYGPLQTKQVVYNFARDLLRNPAELRVLGNGSELRDFVYVKDVVRALLVVAVRGRTDGGVYNVATGVGTTIGELAELLFELRHLPTRISFTSMVRPGDQDRLLGDTAALAAIGGAPICSLVDGLRATLEWFDSARANPCQMAPFGTSTWSGPSVNGTAGSHVPVHSS